MNIEKQKQFIKEFEKIRPVYVELARLLEKILLKAIDQLGYLAIVQVRAKGVESFAKKIIMKAKYEDPLKEVTDLCGGRIILHFQSQVAGICEFIKDKKNFKVDEANSLDQKSKLKVNEFGYRSIHYIITPEKDTIIGIPVDKKFRKLKAEIQVRTLAEHIWADISHDRIYKTELNIPEEWKREAARLSAILENADNTFASMAQAIDSVSNVYELQYETNQALNNIERLETLVEIQKEKPEAGIKNLLDLISVYKVLNQPDKVKSLINEWIKIMKDEHHWKARLNYEKKMIELTTCSGNIHKAENYNKIKAIEKDLEILEKHYKSNQVPSAPELSFLYYRYGCLLQNNPQKYDEALDPIKKAVGLMPENPLFLTALAECIVLRNIDLAHPAVVLFKNTLEKNIIDLEQLIGLGIDAIPAWFAIGRCHFFLGNQKECIKAYSNAVKIITDQKYTTNCSVVDAEIDRFGRIDQFDKKLAEQILLYLNIAMKVANISKNNRPYTKALQIARKQKKVLKKPVVIVAGGASLMDPLKVDSYIEYIQQLMVDFKGTIISGGTNEGIPGLVGRVKQELAKEKPVSFDLLAYLPKILPHDTSKSPAYSHLYTESEGFTALDILSSWTDIILSGVNPSEVILIGIDGGEIADLEFRIALSLGAKVCLIAYSGRAVFNFVQEKPWKDHPNLIQVPEDPLTIWAIVNQTISTDLTQEEIDKLAPLVHEFYSKKRLKELKPEADDINKYKVVMPWEKLDKGLQNSNIQQVGFYQHFLKKVNLGIRKSKNPILFNLKKNLARNEYDLLARLEHARWNAERLFDGWKYGPEKDISAKLNQCITAWDNLDKKTRKWDYDPIDNIPLMLKKIGYEVYELKSKK